jgi:hypothetical protein
MCSKIHTLQDIKQHINTQHFLINEDFLNSSNARNLDIDLGIHGWMCIVGVCLAIFILKLTIERINDLCL